MPPASESLLADLRSDQGMEWVPQAGWLTKVRVDAAAGDLLYDLAVDASGRGAPSRLAAGLDPLEAPIDSASTLLLLLLAVIVAGGSLYAATRRRED